MTDNYPAIVAAEIEKLGEERAKKIIGGWIGAAEDLYLDFKRKEKRNSATPGDGDKNKFAKALSGFANSDGGLLVWGVEAAKDPRNPDSPDVAKAKEPIYGVTAFHAELNTLVAVATKPTVPHVRNYRIYDDKGHDLGYVVTLVPADARPPYRAMFQNDNHFYKRAGSRFYPMEPFDIRDVVFRYNYPKVEVTLERADLDVKSDRHVYALRVVLHNNGPMTLTAFKFEVSVPKEMFFQVAGASNEAVVIAGRQYQKITITRPTGAIDHYRLFPNDDLELFGAGPGDTSILYVMDRVLHSAGRILRDQFTYRLYYENAPPVIESIPVVDLICF